MKNKILTVSQSSVAQALAMDYFCIYFVNLDNDMFIEYSASPEYRGFGLPVAGDDIISFARNHFKTIIYSDDRDLFLEKFVKGKILDFLDKNNSYSIIFRIMFGQDPTYVLMKITKMMKENSRYAVIGISSVDEQMKAREASERANKSSITYSRIAQALAEDYFSIYYVDMATDRFAEFSSDLAYRNLQIEKGGEDFFNLSRENVKRVMYEEDLGAFLAVFTKENLQKVLDEHKTFTISYRLIMGGEPTWVSMKATRLKDEEGNHVIIGVNSIQTQMRQQEEFRKAEKERITYNRVAQALARDYFSIYVVDPVTDRFIEYSATKEYDELGIEKSGEDFFNLSRKNIVRVIYEEDKDQFLATFSKERIMSILEEDGSFTMKYRLVFSGNPVYVSMKATLLDDADGRHLIIGTNNIDAQMKREQEYRRRVAEARTSARNDFLANMSHDIRTPMNAIIGYTNIARSCSNDSRAVMDAVEKIASSSHFLLSLINDILDISKIESGKMQIGKGPCHLGEILRRIEDITVLQAKNKSLRISYQYDTIRHFNVMGDELRIEQVLINILSNAIKYTPEGKTVDLVAKELGPSGERMNHYRFIVRDSGIGISEEYLPHIFESFTREENTRINRVQGTGLGLAITAKVVELMGGKISVSSKLGAGSEFTVDLDLEEMEGEEAASEEGAVPDVSGRRVLLVEDNKANTEIASMVLSQFGLLVENAENGKAGFEKVRDSGKDYYDAVLMDIQMPVMNGFEATKAIRALEGEYFASIPIIAMSANAYDEDVKECLDAGMNSHIAKPFQPDELLRQLHKWMGKAAMVKG